MNIGLVYDLRSDYLKMGFSEEDTAEFDSEETISAIETALCECGHSVERIGNYFALHKKLAAQKSWDLVFNIAEGLYGMGRESLVPCVLDAYGINYTFSDPLAISLTLHKGMAKHILKGCGVATADFAVVNNLGDIDSINLGFPLFAKPAAEGTGKGISDRSIVWNSADLKRVCTELLVRYSQPVLVEKLLEGREFTVGIIGSGSEAVSVGVMEILPRNKEGIFVYSYENKENCESLLDYSLVYGDTADRCADVALRAYRALGCRDAGRVDVRLDGDGIANVIELNPLPGLHPTHSDLPMIWTKAGMSYRQLICSIAAKAKARVEHIQESKAI
ncbi:D-alanine--D-alanine ligase [Deferribacteres bacterium DY0037]|nr:D-alanine--D-alanine ligase [Denitrovibrio acetiphilus]